MSHREYTCIIASTARREKAFPFGTKTEKTKVQIAYTPGDLTLY